jgi:hypothetical protein
MISEQSGLFSANPAHSVIPPSPISGHCKHCYNSSWCHQCCPRNVLLGGQNHRKLLIIPRQSLPTGSQYYHSLARVFAVYHGILQSFMYILRPSIVNYKDRIDNVILVPFSCCSIISFTWSLQSIAEV